MTNSRRTAVFVLERWLLTKDFPANLLPSEGADRAFVQDLVYTTIRRLRPLRKVLGELVRKWPKGELEALLYIGAAQILYMPEVPDYAAVNETVEAAKVSGNANVAKVVNGVLHNLIRRRAEFDEMLEKASPDEREGFPSILYRRWVARFGAEKAAALAKWHNEPSETYLAYADHFEKLPRGKRVNEAAGYADGRFVVQDPATALAVDLMDVSAGEEVLDACAAPGGKAIQLAWRGARVTACEVNPKRRRKLEENARRVKADLAIVESLALPRTFRKVLVDAPCSNSGVLRRRPDARWNWSEEKLAALVKLQAEILERAAALVEAGGRLVYSTCSNEPEENQLQVEAFLARHPEFALVEQRESVPVDSGMDGAFAAALVRKTT